MAHAIDMGLILIAVLALGMLLARRWPRPLMVVPPRNPCGFAPSS
jgi:hypothetical protein